MSSAPSPAPPSSSTLVACGIECPSGQRYSRRWASQVNADFGSSSALDLALALALALDLDLDLDLDLAGEASLPSGAYSVTPSCSQIVRSTMLAYLASASIADSLVPVSAWTVASI